MVIMIILFHYITQCFRMIAFEAKKIFSSSRVQTCTPCLARRKCRSSRPLVHPTRYKIELIFLVIIHANSYDCRRSRQTLGYVSFELMRVMTFYFNFPTYFRCYLISKHSHSKNPLLFSIPNTRNVLKILVKIFIYFQNGRHHFFYF